MMRFLAARGRTRAELCGGGHTFHPHGRAAVGCLGWHCGVQAKGQIQSGEVERAADATGPSKKGFQGIRAVLVKK